MNTAREGARGLVAACLVLLVATGGRATASPRTSGRGGSGTPRPQAVQQRPGDNPREFVGDPVSMDFQSADLRSVLRTFAEISGLNLVIDAGVSGTVDVALVDVPWDQALDVVLRANQLGYEVDGTVVRIAPLAALAAEAELRLARAEQEALGGELGVVTRSLSYARAVDLAALVTGAALSVRGQVQVDERTNTLIVTDLPERLRAARELIDALDRAQPQVAIEARIVQASHDYLRELGIQWGVARWASPESAAAAPPGFPRPVGISGRMGRTQGEETSGPDGRGLESGGVATAVDLAAPSASTAIGVMLGAIEGPLNLDVVLSAAQSEGRVRILSNPRITTQNNVQATITQGDQIPIQTVANNTVTVTFRDAALRLAVTPRITAADAVILQIDIGNDFADFARQVNGVPPIVTQSVRTTVHVGDGETTVIGGIYESARTRSSRRVPGLSRIPLLGRLFRSEADRRRSDELVIFLTPRIVR